MKTSRPGSYPAASMPVDEHLERLGVGAQVRGEAALVPHRGREAAIVELALERVEDLGPHLQGLGERACARGDDHELLEVDAVVGVRAAVDHVHHRHRQDAGVVAAEEAPEGLPGLHRARLGERRARRRGSRSRRAGTCSRAVELDQLPVELGLVAVEAGERVGDLAVRVRDGLRRAFAAPGLAAVAQLGGLEFAGRGARRHRRATARAPGQDEVDLDRRVAPRVEDLACVDPLDRAHRSAGV